MTVLEQAHFQPLTTNQMLLIDGGAWSWGDFGKSIAGGAVGGAAGGAVTGAFAGGVGALPGAGIGALAGAAGGAVTYLAVGWW